jgi:hypothetical protein
MLGQQVWRDACDAGERERPDDLDPSSKEARIAYHRGQVRHLKVASLRLREQLSAAEFMVVQMYFGMQYAEDSEGDKKLKAALNFCTPRFLKTMAAVGNGEISGKEEIKDALGLDGRNLIRSEDKSEELRRALRDVRKNAGVTVEVEDSDLLREGDAVVAGPAVHTTKLVANGQEVAISEDHHGKIEFGQYLVRSADEGTATLVFRG